MVRRLLASVCDSLLGSALQFRVLLSPYCRSGTSTEIKVIRNAFPAYQLYDFWVNVTVQRNNLFLIKPTDALLSQLIFVKKLYMFRAVPLPIIRRFPLYIRHWCMSCRFDDSFQAGPGWNCSSTKINWEISASVDFIKKKIV